jgi:hypothetical protein
MMANLKEKYKPFRKWNTDNVEETFHLQQVQSLSGLQRWLSAEILPTEQEQERLLQLRERLADNVENWNEEELKLKFIAQLLELLDYDTNGCKTFADRIISAEFDGRILSGTVDVLIARGNRIPKAPLLCIHEYKKERGSSDDPLGQVLVAMIVAQRINSIISGSKPVYGAYTVGRLWFLVVLEASEYGVSRGFNAADSNDILALFQVLKHFKQIIPSLL